MAVAELRIAAPKELGSVLEVPKRPKVPEAPKWLESLETIKFLGFHGVECRNLSTGPTGNGGTRHTEHDHLRDFRVTIARTVLGIVMATHEMVHGLLLGTGAIGHFLSADTAACLAMEQVRELASFR